MNFIRLKAFGKINLGLDILRKREDDYHELKMIMQTVTLYDDIFIQKRKDKNIVVNTNLTFLPTNENNIVFKAAKLLKDEFNIKQGVNISLIKRIPVAAGMAGGSSDAASTLVGLNSLFKIGLNKKQLMKLGLKLGADVPYCIMRGTALSEGIGEILTPLNPMPKCYILLVKPPINVSTKYVYKNFNLNNIKEHPDIDGMISAINKGDLYNISNKLANVLETVTIKDYPVIEEIKNKMCQEGALNSLMSGSGPTVFGIFDNFNKADKAYAIFRNCDLVNHVNLVRPYNYIRKEKNFYGR